MILKKLYSIYIFFLFSFFNNNYSQTSLPTKSDYFLNDINKIESLDSKLSKKIKEELNNMVNDFLGEINLKKSWYKEEKRKVDIIENINLNEYSFACRYCGRPYNGRGYTTAMRVVNRVENENSPLNSYCSYKCAQNCILYECFSGPAASVWKEWKVGEETKIERSNRSTKVDKIVYQKIPTWEQIVDFYGGYSELAKKGIEKKDYENGKFDIEGNLISLELINSKECIANVKLLGDLKLNKVPKENYKYKGVYKLSEINVSTIYNLKTPELSFSFPDKKYMALNTNISKSLSDFGISNYMESLKKYKNGMELLIEEMVPNDIFDGLKDIKLIKEQIETERVARLKKEEEQRLARQKIREDKRKAEELLRKIARRNSFSFYGSVPKINFNGKSYQKNKGSSFNSGLSWGTGISTVFSPFKVDYNLHYTSYDLSSDILLIYGDTGNNNGDVVLLPPEKVTAYHLAHNVSFGYDILPDYFIRPFIGIGYQYSGINIDFKTTEEGWNDTEVKQTNTSKTSDIFIHGELIYSINSNYFLGLSISNSLTHDEKSWQNIYLKIGKIFTSDGI